MKIYSLCKTGILAAVFAFTSCSKKEKIAELSKEKIAELSIELDMLSYEAEYHSISDGTYQLSSNKVKMRSQSWIDSVKESDETETDEELPDKSAGEFDSVSFEWSDSGTLKIRELTQENMDDVIPGAPPLKWDEIYELEVITGSKEDFDAGRTISVRYSGASLEQAKKNFAKYIEASFSEIAPIILEQAAGGDVDMTSSQIQSELVTVTISNTPSELSKNKFIIDSENAANIRFKWTLFETK